MQDGIYWVNEYPQHEVSYYLLQKFLGYNHWAAMSRRQLEQQAETQSMNEIMVLNAASQAAFNNVHQKINVLGETLGQKI